MRLVPTVLLISAAIAVVHGVYSPHLQSVIVTPSKTQFTYDEWSNHVDKIARHPDATVHSAELHKGKTVLMDHDDDDDDDNDGPGNRFGRMGREYAQLLANNTRTLNGALRLYRTAMYDQCGQYLHALQTGDSHLQELISPIVTPDAKGRIHPLGFFADPVNLIEYFMLACFGGNSAVTRETFRRVVVWNDVVFFELDFYFQDPAHQEIPGRNLTHVGWAKVAADGRVKALKVLFQRLGMGDMVLPGLAGETQTRAIRNATIQGICSIVVPRCQGPHLQFASMQACQDYYLSLPFGGWERGDQKDFGCVILHQILTQSRPDVHCAHVGPTGGGKCIDHPQPNFYEVDEQILSV